MNKVDKQKRKWLSLGGIVLAFEKELPKRGKHGRK